eukprot:1574343-Lingulodinium_polyedra.AAC.1
MRSMLPSAPAQHLHHPIRNVLAAQQACARRAACSPNPCEGWSHFRMRGETQLRAATPQPQPWCRNG